MDERVEFQNFFEPFLGIENLSLDCRTRNLAWAVYSISLREINKCVQKSKSGSQTQNELVPENLKCVLEHQKKSDSLKSQLKKVLELFQEVDKARTEFLDYFCNWNHLRLQLIEQLRAITSSVDYAVYNWDIVKILRRTLMVVGGITIFGTIAIPSVTLAAMPVATTGISGAAAIFAWRQLSSHGICENEALVKVQDIREKDLERIKHLEPWFDLSEQLLKALTSLVGLPVLEIMMKDWKTFLHQSKEMHDEIWLKPMLKQWVRDVNSCWILQPKFGLQFTPIVTTFVFVTLFLQERNISLLESISKTRHFLIKQPSIIPECEDRNEKDNQKNRDVVSKFGKIRDDLRTSDLMTVTQKLSDEQHFLETVYTTLKLSAEEEISCVDVLVPRKSVTQEDDEIQNEAVLIEELQRRSAIIIFNVPCNVEEEEIVTSAEALLPPGYKGTIKHLKTMPGLIGNHWVLEINKEHLSILKKQSSIKLGSNKCRIEKYFGIHRCTKCQRFGHSLMKCKNEHSCSECGGNHSVKQCTATTNTCINCVRFNENNNTDFNTNHTVDGRKCPAYINLKEHLRSGKTLASWLKMAG